MNSNKKKSIRKPPYWGGTAQTPFSRPSAYLASNSSLEQIKTIRGELGKHATKDELRRLKAAEARHYKRGTARENPSAWPNETAANELFRYAVNNTELYRSRTTPIIANLKRKKKKGVYNAQLALKLWRYAADDAAKRYTFERGERGSASSPHAVKGYGIFDVPTRELAAKYIAGYYADEIGEQAMNVRMAKPILKNPASAKKYIHLQEKRGDAWITIAMFPLNCEALARQVFNRVHRRKPNAQLRLFK